MIRRVGTRITNDLPSSFRTLGALSRRLPFAKSAASYFTNTDLMKKDDPYAALGLTWGATVTEIKDSYKRLARELHPDVNTEDTPEQAIKKFKVVQASYAKLMDVKGSHRDDLADQWAFQIWRNADIVAQERTDVAGLKRKRPVKPADSEKTRQWGLPALGHPDGKRGNALSRSSEYLGDGSGKKTGTVGSGINKWVQPKEFKPWDPNSMKFKRKVATTGKANPTDG